MKRRDFLLLIPGSIAFLKSCLKESASIIVIEENKCLGCGECVDVCNLII